MIVIKTCIYYSRYDDRFQEGRSLHWRMADRTGRAIPLPLRCFGAYSNVFLNNSALGKECGERNLFYHEPGTGNASLSKRRLEHFGIKFDSSEKVNVSTLDEYGRSQEGIPVISKTADRHGIVRIRRVQH